MAGNVTNDSGIGTNKEDGDNKSGITIEDSLNNAKQNKKTKQNNIKSVWRGIRAQKRAENKFIKESTYSQIYVNLKTKSFECKSMCVWNEFQFSNN